MLRRTFTSGFDRSRLARLILLGVGTTFVIAMLGLSGCGKAEPSTAPPPPPTELTVSQPIRQTVSDFVEFTGHTDAVQSVDIRARVAGYLQKIDFADGALVKQGQLLFEIDPSVYQAEVDKAQALLQAARAELEKAQADLGIKQEMYAGNAASKLDVIQAQAAASVATASIASSAAMLEQANINLGYTKIYSPISGRIDRSRVDAGNLVGADGNTLLANIVQADPIYVYFNVDELTLQKFQARRIKDGGVSGVPKLDLSMLLALGDSPDFTYKGVVNYADNKVDPSTGTMQVRGELPNPNYALTPGFFARVRVPDGDPYEAVLVPDRAIGVDQGIQYLLVVNDQNVVEFRPIVTGTQHGQMRVITKGVTADDWVIVDGILRTRPGATVSPKRIPLPADETDESDLSGSAGAASQP
jgi:RND family efflux transporter MFP subunit